MDICGHLWTFVDICGDSWRFVANFGHLWPIVDTCGHVTAWLALTALLHVSSWVFLGLHCGYVANLHSRRRKGGYVANPRSRRALVVCGYVGMLQIRAAGGGSSSYEVNSPYVL